MINKNNVNRHALWNIISGIIPFWLAALNVQLLQRKATKGCHLGHFCWAVMMEHNSETSIGKSNAKAKGMMSILNRVIILKQTQKSGREIQSTKALYWMAKLGWKAQRSRVRRKENFKVKSWSDCGRLTKWIAIREERKKNAQRQDFTRNLRSIPSSNRGLCIGPQVMVYNLPSAHDLIPLSLVFPLKKEY